MENNCKCRSTQHGKIGTSVDQGSTLFYHHWKELVDDMCMSCTNPNGDTLQMIYFILLSVNTVRFFKCVFCTLTSAAGLFWRLCSFILRLIACRLLCKGKCAALTEERPPTHSSLQNSSHLCGGYSSVAIFLCSTVACVNCRSVG